MSKIYLINVGANTAHRKEARSPILPDGTWRYVAFPNADAGVAFPKDVVPYVRVKAGIKTHLDPDWTALTYGDNCAKRRARALFSVTPGDILLFWALLWRLENPDGDIFAGNARCWGLLGALRVQQVLESGKSLDELPRPLRERAQKNVHVEDGQVEATRGVRVFLGERKHSARFLKAVDLGIGRDDGLLRQTVTATDGRQIEWDRPPRWNSVTRSCRAILNLDERCDLTTAKKLAKCIARQNPEFDLLAGL
jgi:hypothetical protein